MKDNSVNPLKAEREIKSIINNSKVDANVQDVLIKIFTKLKGHEVERISEIVHNIECDWNNRNKVSEFLPIYTILVSDAELDIYKETKRWYQLTEYGEGFFLDCSVDKLNELINREFSVLYKSHQISFSLCLDDVFVKQEKILFKVAKQYGIQRPIIFSPWSRRYVRVKVKSDLGRKLEYRNILRAVHELSEYIKDDIIDAKLMWNVEICDIKPLQSSQRLVSPDGDEKTFITLYPLTEGAKLWIDADISEKKTDDRGDIKVYSWKELDNVPAKSINITTPNNIEECKELFENKFDFSRRPVRLLTSGDINCLLKLFDYDDGNNCFSCHFESINKMTEKKEISRYSTSEGMNYQYSKKDMLYYKSRRSLPICYVSFTGTEKWLADYANYVLSYLEYHYPEYQWAGVQE